MTPHASNQPRPENASDPRIQPDVQPDIEPGVQPDIEPDTKDWTWVLDRSCPDCGFDARGVQADRIAAATRTAAERWATVLARPGGTIRPAPGVWSPLEYQCHVRDVCDLFESRVRLMLSQDDPAFGNWDQDATAVEKRYADQDPALVADELDDAARRIAATYDAVPREGWARTGRRSDGASFTVLTLGQYFLHDVYHHLHDVGA